MMCCTFHAVKFSKLPHENMNNYVCIPDSWVKWRCEDSQDALIAYPDYEIPKLEEDVKCNKKCSDSWNFYKVIIKYTAMSYDRVTHNVKSQNTYLEESDNEREAHGDEMNNFIEKLKLINKKITPVARSSTDFQVVDTSVIKQPEVAQEINPAERWESQSRTSSSSSVNKRRKLTHQDISIQQHNKQQQNLAASDYSDAAADFRSRETNQSRVSLNLPIPVNQSLISFQKEEKIFLTELSNSFKYVQTHTQQHQLMMDGLQTYFHRIREKVNNLVELFNNYIEWKNRVYTESTLLCDTTELMRQKLQVMRWKKENEGENNRTVEENRGSSNFILPPEYDPQDSRWTLRYRNAQPALVEIMRHGNIYINAIKLANCRRQAKDSKSLARLLMMEIFSDNALRVCSLTGAKSKPLKSDETSVRPGLDENGRTVLLAYVEKFAAERKWGLSDKQAIMNSLRNKLQETRYKYENVDKTTNGWQKG